jgi:hypothetical protein
MILSYDEPKPIKNKKLLPSNIYKTKTSLNATVYLKANKTSKTWKSKDRHCFAYFEIQD